MAKRTSAAQAQRDRQIPRPPDGLGLRVVGQNEWLAVWDRVIAQPSVKLVGYALARWADWEDGAEVRPGNDLLMRRTGLRSDKTVRAALTQIRDSWGLVWRYHEGYKSGRQGIADVYRLTIPDDILDGRVPLLTPEDKMPEPRYSEPRYSEPGFSVPGTPVMNDPEPRYSPPPTPTETQTETQTVIEVHAFNGSVEGSGGDGQPPEAPAFWVKNPRSEACKAGTHKPCPYAPGPDGPSMPDAWCHCTCHKRRAGKHAMQGAGAAR